MVRFLTQLPKKKQKTRAKLKNQGKMNKTQLVFLCETEAFLKETILSLCFTNDHDKIQETSTKDTSLCAKWRKLCH